MRPLIVVAFLVAVVVAILWESHRQHKKYGKGTGTGTSLARAGLLEIQNLLEPDRKVEVLREMESKRDLLVEIDEKGDEKDP